MCRVQFTMSLNVYISWCFCVLRVVKGMQEHGKFNYREMVIVTINVVPPLVNTVTIFVYNLKISGEQI